MFRNLMNGVSLSAMLLRDADNEQGSAAEAKAKLRESIAKGITVTARSSEETVPYPKEDDESENDEKDDDNDKDADEENAEGEAEEKEEVGETAADKKAKEAQELKDKEDRKQARIQKRIDKAVAAQRVAEDEVVKLRAQLEANPEKKLTEEEVQAKAEVIAAEKVAAKELENLQKEFDKACDKLQNEGVKLDKEFTPKVVAMADELGPIPSRVIGVLSDLDNGAEVLKFMIDDIDEAEKIYELKNKPEKLAIALVRIADKLTAAKRPKPKPISQVPDAVEPVKSSRVQSLTITEADTKNMDNYVAKRSRQMAEKRKIRGY